MNLAQRLAYFKGVETLALIRNLGRDEIRDRGHTGTSAQLGLELRQSRGFPICESLYPAVRQVPDPAGETEPVGHPPGEVTKSHSLNTALNEKAFPHACFRLRSFQTAKTIGSTEITMIARMTRLKCSRTAGRLPKR